MSGQKHVPKRMCVICRESLPKRGLTRLVYVAGAGVTLDPSGKAAGRGAYLCTKRSCWETAASSNILGTALRISLTDNDRALIRTHGHQMPELHSSLDI